MKHSAFPDSGAPVPEAAGAGRVLVVAGPTASGKTALSLRLAGALKGEIVSADSMQIYRGMDIGTAKATPAEQAEVPHHMLDLLEPGENYSVSRYVEDASAVCDALLGRGALPVVTGGTGLYIDALLAGRQFAGTSDLSGQAVPVLPLPSGADPNVEAAAGSDLRKALAADYERLGGEAMRRRLQAVDPERAAMLSPTDRRRIIRALEVYALTGETITEHDRRSRMLPPAYSALYVVLEFCDRDVLYSRIEQRVDRMCRDGLFEETQRLLEASIPESSTCMQAIGYRQAAMALRGECSREEAVALIKQATRRYAKRQLTWFRRREDALRLHPDRMTPEEMAETVLAAFSEPITG